MGPPSVNVLYNTTPPPLNNKETHMHFANYTAILIIRFTQNGHIKASILRLHSRGKLHDSIEQRQKETGGGGGALVAIETGPLGADSREPRGQDVTSRRHSARLPAQVAPGNAG